MYVKFFVLLCVVLMFGVCSNDQVVEVVFEKLLSVLFIVLGEIVLLDSVSVLLFVICGMWQMKVQFLVLENINVKEGDMLFKFDGQ